jgi:hypothetical protein
VIVQPWAQFQTAGLMVGSVGCKYRTEASIWRARRMNSYRLPTGTMQKPMSKAKTATAIISLATEKRGSFTAPLS